MTSCFRCGRTADNIPEWKEIAAIEEMTPEEYARDDGTYNPDTDHFACDSCYVAIGMPTTPWGWKAP